MATRRRLRQAFTLPPRSTAVLYRAAKATWRYLIPGWLSAHVFSGRSLVSRPLLRLKTLLEATAPHNELYDRRYFLFQEKEMEKSAMPIADSICQRLNPKLVVDVGCGTGSVLAALARRGVNGLGLEKATSALAICREKGLKVIDFDLVHPKDHRLPKCDLVLSTEVAEHLPEACAESYVELLCQLGRVVLITAATPGQGGVGHVNEQANEYWIARFARLGYAHDWMITRSWRDDWRKRGVDTHRAKNVMFFVRAED